MLLSTLMWYNYMYSHNYIWWDLIIKWSWTFVISQYLYHAHGIIIIVNLSTSLISWTRVKLFGHHLNIQQQQKKKKRRRSVYVHAKAETQQANQRSTGNCRRGDRASADQSPRPHTRLTICVFKRMCNNPTTAFIILYYHRHSITLKEKNILR